MFATTVDLSTKLGKITRIKLPVGGGIRILLQWHYWIYVNRSIENLGFKHAIENWDLNSIGNWDLSSPVENWDLSSIDKQAD